MCNDNYVLIGLSLFFSPTFFLSFLFLIKRLIIQIPACRFQKQRITHLDSIHKEYKLIASQHKSCKQTMIDIYYRYKFYTSLNSQFSINYYVYIYIFKIRNFAGIPMIFGEKKQILGRWDLYEKNFRILLPGFKLMMTLLKSRRQTLQQMLCIRFGKQVIRIKVYLLGKSTVFITVKRIKNIIT